MVKENSSEIGFEKQIWDAADELRGSMDAAEYKHVVLGLIFLKYLSDKFDERYNELLKEDGGRWKEDIDEYKKVNVFFVPPEARWDVISKKKTLHLRVFCLKLLLEKSLIRRSWVM